MKQRYRSDYKRIMSLIYEDQPISPQADREIVFIPERIKSIRSMGRGVAAYRQPRELIFLHQAKMMEDYGDDYYYDREIPAYQPTYESLTDEQLRGYFGWRSRLRKGQLEKAPQAFAFIYLYELINLIGTGSAEEGFFKFSEFASAYGKIDPSVVLYAEQWLIDYVLYYDLNPILLADRKPAIYDRFLAVLLLIEKRVIRNGAQPDLFRQNPYFSPQSKEASGTKTVSAEDVFRAVWFLSGMRLIKLPAYLKDSEFFMRVTARTFADMCDYYNTHRKQTLLEDYVGKAMNKPARLFAGAVFHENKNSFLEHALKEAEKEVRLSPLTVYHYEYGKWAVKTYPRDYQNRKLSELLLTVDGVIREREGDPSAGLCGMQTKWIRKLIGKAADLCRVEIEEEKARRVEIDLDALDGIRGSAEETMEKLITDEDLDLVFQNEDGNEAEKTEEYAEQDFDLMKEAFVLTEQEGVPAEQGDTPPEELPFELSEEELCLIRTLLEGSDLSGVKTNGKMMSVIVDSINEKFFDEFGDVVIEDGNPPRMLDDYIEDIRELLGI